MLSTGTATSTGATGASRACRRVFEQFPTLHGVGRPRDRRRLGAPTISSPTTARTAWRRCCRTSRTRGLTYDEGMELVQRMIAAAKQVYFRVPAQPQPADRGGHVRLRLRARRLRLLCPRRAGTARRLSRLLPHPGTRAVRPLRRLGGCAEAGGDAVPVRGLGGAGAAHPRRGGERRRVRGRPGRRPAGLLGARVARRRAPGAARHALRGGQQGDQHRHRQRRCHVSAVFSLDDDRGNRIYQLTSSPITYNMSRIQSWMLRLGAADDGLTDGGSVRLPAIHSGNARVRLASRAGLLVAPVG